jgi:hypothetical protein
VGTVEDFRGDFEAGMSRSQFKYHFPTMSPLPLEKYIFAVTTRIQAWQPEAAGTKGDVIFCWWARLGHIGC